MNLKRVSFFIVLTIFFVNYSILFSYPQNNHDLCSNSLQSSGEYDQTININKENYTIFESINVVFNISYYPSSNQYFTYVFSESNEYSGKLYESEHIPTNFSIFDSYIFNLKDIDLNISSNGEVHYIILMLHYDGASPWSLEFEDCAVNIERETLSCDYNFNNTIIEFNEISVFELKFNSEINDSYVYNNSRIFYTIINNGIYIENETSLYTNELGQVNITFFSNKYEEIGAFKLTIIVNESNFFQLFTTYFAINVISKQIDMRLSENSPEFLYINKNIYENITYPIYIEFYDQYNDLFYDPEMNPIIQYNSNFYEFIDIFNGTFYYNLVLNNTEQFSWVNISINSIFYSIENISAKINVSKRDLVFNCIFPETLNFSSNTDISLFFEIFDKLDTSFLCNLSSDCILQYYYNNEWHTLITNPEIDNQKYKFILSNHYLIGLNEEIEGDFLFKIIFKGNSFYYSTNSSLFIVKRNVQNNGILNHNYVLELPILNIIITVLSLFVIPTSSFYVTKFISKKVRRTFKMNEIKIRV